MTEFFVIWTDASGKTGVAEKGFTSRGEAQDWAYAWAMPFASNGAALQVEECRLLAG